MGMGFGGNKRDRRQNARCHTGSAMHILARWVRRGCQRLVQPGRWGLQAAARGGQERNSHCLVRVRLPAAGALHGLELEAIRCEEALSLPCTGCVARGATVKQRSASASKVRSKPSSISTIRVRGPKDNGVHGCLSCGLTA